MNFNQIIIIGYIGKNAKMCYAHLITRDLSLYITLP